MNTKYIPTKSNRLLRGCLKYQTKPNRLLTPWPTRSNGRRLRSCDPVVLMLSITTTTPFGRRSKSPPPRSIIHARIIYPFWLKLISVTISSLLLPRSRWAVSGCRVQTEWSLLLRAPRAPPNKQQPGWIERGPNTGQNSAMMRPSPPRRLFLAAPFLILLLLTLLSPPRAAAAGGSSAWVALRGAAGSRKASPAEQEGAAAGLLRRLLPFHSGSFSFQIDSKVWVPSWLVAPSPPAY